MRLWLLYYAKLKLPGQGVFILMFDARNKVPIDSAVEVMMETEQTLPSLYRETSMGGLALLK